MVTDCTNQDKKVQEIETPDIKALKEQTAKLHLVETNSSAGESISDTVSENMENEENIEEEDHPLSTEWTLWYMNGTLPQSSPDEWVQNLVQLGHIRTVEEFWQILNYIQVPSKLNHKHDYMFFRSGVVPKWEDEQNKVGGAWKIILPSSMRKTDLNRMWTEALLMLVGGQDDETIDNEIIGLYLNRRQREDRINLWTRNADNAEATIAIGQKLKENLTLSKESEINYLRHADVHNPNRTQHQSWQKKRNSYTMYTV